MGAMASIAIQKTTLSSPEGALSSSKIPKSGEEIAMALWDSVNPLKELPDFSPQFWNFTVAFVGYNVIYSDVEVHNLSW